MEKFSVYEDDDDDDIRLQQKFKSLEKDWDFFKQSKPRNHHRRYRSSSNVKTKMNMRELLDNSPRKLMCSLQHPQKRFSSSPFDGKEEWKVRDNALAVLEIMRERMEAIESGQLKGRNLLEALENAAAVESDDEEMGCGCFTEEMICSACSSVLIHGSEVTTSLDSYSSSSSPTSSGAAAADDDENWDVGRFGDSCLLNVAEKGKEMEEEDEDVCVDEGISCGSGKKMVVLVLIAVIFAFGVILFKSFENGYFHEDLQTMLKPT